MNFQRRWIRRDLPTEVVTKPVEPYASSATIIASEGQQLDIDLQRYVSQGPVQILEKPYFMSTDETHLKGTVPQGKGKQYKIVIEDKGRR